jgi:MFS family permease
MPDYISGSSEMESERLKSLLNREFLLITLSGFIFFFNFHAFLLLPIRIKELGGSESDIGFIMGAASLSTIFTTPGVGMLVDRWGRKWFIALGGLVMSLTTLPFAYMDTLNFLFPLLRIMHGAAFSLCFISAGTLTADFAPVAKRSQALGLFGVFTIVNYALAPFVGKRVVESFGFDVFFKVVFIFGLLSFLIALLIRESKTATSDPPDRNGFLTTLFRNGVLVAATTLMISGSGFIPTLTFIPVFAESMGVESFDLFFLAYTLSTLFVRVAGGWIPDSFGKKRAAIPSLFFFALSIMAIGFASNATHFMGAGILFGMSHGLVYPSIYALVIDLTPDVDRGKAFAICSVSFTLGGTLGSFIYGVIAEHLGFQSMYMAAGSVCLMGFFIFSLFGRDKVTEDVKI